ncbi:MAG: sensor histidine kinase [Planctomycetota bacterium]|jgi:hypothetical protein
MSETPGQGSSASASGFGEATQRFGRPSRVTNIYESLATRIGPPLEALVKAAERLDANGPGRAELEFVQLEARRCRAIVEQLAALRRGSVFQRVPVSAAQLFGHVAVTTAERRRNTAIAWREEIAPDAPRISGDPFRLQIALEALAANAIDAVTDFRGQGSIVVSAGPAPDGRLVLGITDDGHGMSPTVAARCREAFYSTRPARLGLGLTLVQTILEEHRGEFGLRTQLGGGTTVSLLLPDWVDGPATKIDSPPPMAHRARRVLLAVNDPDAAVELASACELIGWHYHVAVTPDDAALLAARGPYDAAVVATGLTAGDTPVADVVNRQRGLTGRVIRLRLPEGPAAPGAVSMPESPEAFAVSLGLALAGQAGTAGW